MARIAIGGFHHETNSFVLPETDFAYFASHRDRPPLVRGEDVVSWLSGTSFALSGFMAAMRGHDLVPLVWTSGGAGGPVTADAFERIAGELVGRLSEAMPVDAVYLDLHGAMVSADFEDGEGELLRRVRAVVGPAVPVTISLDYHANVTPEMVAHTDGLVAYLTYPHVDRAETGGRAARVVEALLARGRPTGRALRKAPFLIPLNGQCTLVEPSKGVVARTRTCEGGLVSLSYLAGFPPSDLHWCGPSVIAHAWSQAEADGAADSMMAAIEAEEPRFAERMVPPEQAVAEAMALVGAGATRPVVIADTQDNPGCGGTADTTGLLRALVEAGAEGAALGFLCDPLAAAAAHAAGEGAELRLALGGRSGPEGVVPFEATFRVLRLGEGRFRTSGAVSGRREVDLGPMALLVIGGVSVAVTSKRMQALDQEPFRHLGIEPARQCILALKSTCHFRAEFEPIADAVIVALAPGYYLADPTSYPFRRLRAGVRLKPMGEVFGAVAAG
ncbi:M81 family metallopeptidase [uncultured Enterovirga sp.]|uniref:M81 family metallopeptidase n=1 Tax=uncultured Enterovirga sp. TaxID=2026352 RepID=UPI0035CC41C8